MSDIQQQSGAGVARRQAELAAAGLLLVLAVLAIWANAQVGAGWSDSGPQAGYFPLRIGVILGGCALLIAYDAVRSPAEAFASREQLYRVCQVLVPLAIYVGAIGVLGIYVASAIFIAAFMRWAGRYPVWKGAVLGACTAALMFFVFETQFQVPLPKGALERAIGY